MAVTLVRPSLRSVGTATNQLIGRKSQFPCFYSLTGRIGYNEFVKQGIRRPTFIHSPSAYPLAANVRSVHYFLSSSSLKSRHFTVGVSYVHVSSVLLFFTVLGIAKEAVAKDAFPKQEERIKNLIEKPYRRRTIDEKIELFNYLLKKGTEEAEKAKDTDAVIFFGNTDGGKSTLVNFLCGCKMVKDNKGNIIVQPPPPEFTKIGIDPTASCTLIPTVIRNVSFHTIDFGPTETSEGVEMMRSSKEHFLTFCDMPGFRDNRGIELELAQVIVMKKVVEYAKSVRLVMVFERDNICPEKGSKIKAAADLLEKRFNYNVGKKPGSLSLVVTKTTGQDKIDTIKKEIAEKTSDCSIDLSPHAIIYDPLDVNDKDRLLNIIFSNKNYIGLEASIGIDRDSLWDARALGKEVEEGVQKHLNKKPEEEIEKNKEEEEMLQAVKKLEFTYGIANLGNPDLTNLHESAQKAVRKYAEKIIREIKPKATYTISKANALKKYDILRGKFKPFVPFDDLNEGLRENIDLMDDPKAWYERAWLYIRKHTVGISQKEQEERYFFGWKP